MFAVGKTEQLGQMRLAEFVRRSRRSAGIRRAILAPSLSRNGGRPSSRPASRASLLARTTSEYLSLAVLPDGHAFTAKYAAVMLNDRTPHAKDESSARRVVEVLERWSTVGSARGSTYRMHDAHSDFAREKLEKRPDARDDALRRWVMSISSRDRLKSTDPYVLNKLWAAIQSADGGSRDRSRPYVEALEKMDGAIPRNNRSCGLVSRSTRGLGRSKHHVA